MKSYKARFGTTMTQEELRDLCNDCIRVEDFVLNNMQATRSEVAQKLGLTLEFVNNVLDKLASRSFQEELKTRQGGLL